MRGVVLACLLAACLREPAPPSFDDAAIAMACMDLAGAICNERMVCAPDDYSILRTFPDVQTCLDREGLTCINNLHVKDTHQTPDTAEHCAQSYSGLSCADYFDNDVQAACQPPSGPGAIGSPCSVPFQCATKFCMVASDQECGTCQALPAFGSSCSASSDCGAGVACVIPSGATTGTCTAYAPPGRPCLTDSIPCEAGYACMGDDVATATMGTCVAEAQMTGAPCDNSRKTAPPCNSAGFYCQGSSHTCQPIALANAGAPCGNVGTVTTVCAAGGLCVKAVQTDPTGTCVAPVPDGAPCNASAGPPCVFPAKCVSTDSAGDGTCVVEAPADCF